MTGYDTKTIATIIHQFLQQLDIPTYHLVSHDVGGWVAYPYTALFGNEVHSLTIMDAGIPGVTMPNKLSLNPELAWQTWHFAFHLVPDIPEMLITGKESEYLDWFLRRKSANPEVFSEEDIQGSTIQFCGHFLPEEQPEIVANELLKFFGN